MDAPSESPAPARDRRKNATNSLGEPVSLWFARRDQALRLWRRGERLRETLRRICTELEFPLLLAGRRENEYGDDYESGAEHAHMDQVNLNLLMRHLNKLRNSVGDEEPEIRVPRERGRTTIAEAEDRLLTTVMGIAGGPECLMDSVGNYFTEGNCAIWVLLPDLPGREELAKMSEDMRTKQQRASSEGFGIEPTLGEDPERVGSALKQSVYADGDAVLQDAVTAPAGSGIETPMDRVEQAAVKYAKFAREARKKGLGWMDPAGQVVCELQPIGPGGTLYDPRATSMREVRWVMRTIRMPVEEARECKAFHPEYRKQIQPTKFDDKSGYEPLKGVSGLPETFVDTENSIAEIIEIWDKKTNSRHYISEGCDRYLELDSTNPYSNEYGLPIIERGGGHPGFFPCVFDPLLKGTRRSIEILLGIPIGALGLSQQLEVIKLISAYLSAIKRSSAGVYIHKLSPEIVEPVRWARDGTMIEVGDEIENLKDAIQQVEWKPPPVELYREIDREIARYAMAANFPLIELTSSPSGQTLGQDELSMSSGLSGQMEVIRRLEVNYSQMVSIARELVVHFYAPHLLVGLAGREGLALKAMWQSIGTPPGRIQIRLASSRADQNPVKVKQALDLYELLKDEVNPITGLPYWDLTYLPEEASKRLDFGELPPFKAMIPEMAQTEKQVEGAAAAAPAGPEGNGMEAPPEEGAPPEGGPDAARQGAKQRRKAVRGSNTRRAQKRGSAEMRNTNPSTPQQGQGARQV